MYIDGYRYHISKRLSIYTSRVGKMDIRISVRSNYSLGGMRHLNGDYYRTIAVICPETLDYIRHYERIPDLITLDLLAQWGFINHMTKSATGLI